MTLFCFTINEVTLCVKLDFWAHIKGHLVLTLKPGVTVFHLVDRLLWLLLTLPVSTATAERAFSSLKIIKTRLRNKMEDEYLANSLLVHIEGEIAGYYGYDEIINDFKNMKTRRVDL